MLILLRMVFFRHYPVGLLHDLHVSIHRVPFLSIEDLSLDAPHVEDGKVGDTVKSMEYEPWPIHVHTTTKFELSTKSDALKRFHYDLRDIFISSLKQVI